METNEILILTTGGTIDKVYFDAKSEYAVGDSIVGSILQQAEVHHPYHVASILQKDSLELTDDDRQLILDTITRHTNRHIVITHGTDTMTETARVIRPASDRTIVLTGSLAPARFAMSDAIFNIGMAFAAAQALPHGVYICMNGTVWDATQVRKDRAANRFVTMD